MGPRCIDTGLPCDFVTSSCNNRTQKCIASGPGKDMMDSTRIIGAKQFDKAWVNRSGRVPVFQLLPHTYQHINTLKCIVSHLLNRHRKFSTKTHQPWSHWKALFNLFINLLTCQTIAFKFKTQLLDRKRYCNAYSATCDKNLLIINECTFSYIFTIV